MPPKVPKTIRVHGLDFDIWQLSDGRLAFDYVDGSVRRVVKRRSLEKLREDAERIALNIVNANTAAKDMSADEHRIYVAAREALAPLGTDVDRGARILAEASSIVGGIDRIIEACRFFAKAAPTISTADSGAVVAHYIRHISADNLSEIYVRNLKADLAKFAAKFPGQLATVRASELADWLLEMPVGLRRRRKLRDQLVALFNFARDNDYLPEGLRTEAEKVKRPKVARKAPAIYTPEELDLVITQAAQPADSASGRKDYTDFLPAITIAAFAGLRWAEIQRLDWSHIHWADKVIEVGEENKTGYRLVPIEPNLMSWLSPYRDARGAVCTAKRPDHVMTGIRTRAGLPATARRYANALRHSYVTYLVAVTKNMPLVAANSGHTVAELRRSYHRASLESAGKKWFGISRDQSNVLQMPLMSFKLA